MYKGILYQCVHNCNYIEFACKNLMPNDNNKDYIINIHVRIRCNRRLDNSEVIIWAELKIGQNMKL